MRPDIYPVKTIGKGILSVMAKPVSGEWIEDEFKGIAAFGIHQIVSFLEPSEAKELGLQDEAALSQANGMKFVSFPIVDRGLPQSVDAYVKLVHQLHQQIQQGKNTVIHCRGGIGRTGIVAAGILVLDGMSVDDAFTLLSEKRGVGMPDTEEQRDWVEQQVRAIRA